MLRGKLLGHLGALFVVIAWGTSFIATKVLMTDAQLSPIEVYVYRFGAAYLLLLLLTFRKIFANNWKDEINLFLCGVAAGSLFYILENVALQHTSTGNVSLLSCLSPMITAALMALIFRVRLETGLIIGSLIAFVGVFFVVFSHGDGFAFNPLGDLLALSSSLAWAIYAVGVKRLVPIYDSLFITRKLFFYGVVTACPLIWMSDEAPHLVDVFTNATNIMSFLFLVILCSLLAYVVWNYCLKALGPVTTNNYLYLQPPVTMVAGYFVLGETISLMGYIGCVLIIGGLIFSDKFKAVRKLHQVRK